MKHRIRLVFLLVAVGTALRVSAQPAAYTYDQAGNVTGTTPGAAGGPAITTGPQSELLQPNSLATFSVAATGVGLSYQWLSNGIPILGATGDSLVVSNLVLIGTNLGYFSVIVSNAAGLAVTSAPAALWPDVNGNGIPDWWEMYYFGNLNQSADGDFDGDGVNNLDEYLEGTNPTNAASFNPRLSVEASHGSVAVSPLQPYYSMGQLVTLTATADPGHEFVAWSGSVNATKPEITIVMSTNESVSAVFGFPLGVAVDDTNLVWTTSGGAPWYGQAEVSHDGLGSAQTGPIVAFWNGAQFVGDQTTLQTVADISQTMLMSFWWNVSCRPPNVYSTNGLSFAIDGVTLATISGEAVGWQQVQTNLVAGRHTLTWTYAKGPVDVPDNVPFADAGWVDQFSLVSTNAQIQSPILSILKTTTNTMVIYWAAAPGFVLQQTPALAPSAWANVTNPVNVVNSLNQVVLSPAPTNQFYRLQYQ